MPTLPTTPDYYVKSGDKAASVADTGITPPGFASDVWLVLRPVDGTAAAVSIVGSLGPGTPSATVDTTQSTLTPGQYYAEWLFADDSDIGAATQTQRLPADTYKLLEIVEKLS